MAIAIWVVKWLGNSDKQNSVIESIKNATVELLILSLLEKGDMHTYAIMEKLDILSDGFFKITFPYAAIYKLLNNNYIFECGKKIDANRRRQFYSITPEGRKYLNTAKKEFIEYQAAAEKIINNSDNIKKRGT